MKVIVTAPRGKMGKLITQVAASRDDMELVAGIGPKGRDYIGTDLGTVAMVGKELHVPVVDDLESVIDKCDVIIDFSTKEMAMEVLDLAIRHKKGLVCGSTGFSDEEMKRFEDAASSIPMLYAANTSKLVNVMNKVLEFITKTVGEELDIEILEMHDQWKKDERYFQRNGRDHGTCTWQRIIQYRCIRQRRSFSARTRNHRLSFSARRQYSK